MPLGEVQVSGPKVRWTIPDFFPRTVKIESCYCSPSFQCGDTFWYFRFWPYGRFNCVMTSLVLKPEQDEYLKDVVWVILGIEDGDGNDLYSTEGKFNWDSHEIESNWFADQTQLLKDRQSKDVTLFCNFSFAKDIEDAATSPSKETIPDEIEFLETLSNHLGKIYNTQTDSDCVLKCGEVRFPVHRALLSARSEVFGAMFHHDIKMVPSEEVDIPDIESAIMEHVLNYMYKGKVGGLTGDTAVNMYMAADKYGLLEMRNACLEYLLNKLTVDNICDAIVLAYKHEETKLTQTAIQFFDKNLTKVTETDRWKKLLGENPFLASKILSESYLQSKKNIIS